LQSPDAIAPAPTPPTTLSVNTPSDANPKSTSAADEPKKTWPPPLHGWQLGHGLGIEGTFRVGGRFGSTNEAADSEERAGLGFDLGLWLRLAEEYSFGFAVKRADLGGTALTQGESIVNAGYATTVLELGARSYPVRGRQAELFLGLRVGMAWQDVNATGLRPSLDLQPAVAFECSDVGGPNFALGAEVGGSWRLTNALWLTGNVGFDGYALSAGRIGNCVAGVGSTTALSFGGGLLYTFDLGGERKLAALPRRPAL
jgi:hypothetical protein